MRRSAPRLPEQSFLSPPVVSLDLKNTDFTTADLVVRAIEGDRDAFGRLSERHAPAVFGLAYYWTRNSTDAEDIAQETMFQALEQLETLREPDRFAPWLRTIATNLCRIWHRERQRSIGSLDDPDLSLVRDVLASQEPQPSEVVEGLERDRLIGEMLARLPKQARLTATLYYLKEQSYEEIGAFLDIPAATVRVRLHRARKLLKKEAIEMFADFAGDSSSKQVELKDADGILHIQEHGWGFLRPKQGAESDPADIYVSHSQIKRFGLKEGDQITGPARPQKGEERYWALVRLVEVNGEKHTGVTIDQ